MERRLAPEGEALARRIQTAATAGEAVELARAAMAAAWAAERESVPDGAAISGAVERALAGVAERDQGVLVHTEAGGNGAERGRPGGAHWFAKRAREAKAQLRGSTDAVSRANWQLAAALADAAVELANAWAWLVGPLGPPTADAKANRVKAAAIACVRTLAAAGLPLEQKSTTSAKPPKVPFKPAPKGSEAPESGKST